MPVTGIGYEGSTQADLIARLRAAGAAAQPAALLCLEADEARCHRHVVLEHLGLRVGDS
jgi:Protein of unknown function, DUF488